MKDSLKQEITILLDSIDKEACIDEELRSYLATPIIEHLVALLEANLDEEQDTLSFAYDVYDSLATIYVRLLRFVISAKYNQKALEAAIKLYKKYGVIIPTVIETFSHLLRDRNYYVDDDCEDVLDLLKEVEIIGENKIKEIYEERMQRRRHLKHDPIEMSDEYLAVIDEVEKEIDDNRTISGMGSCHEIWFLKAKFLAERGIVWHSPAMLNRNVMFD